MNYLIWIIFLVPQFLISDEYLLDLGLIGSVRYTYEDGRLLSVERLSVSDDVTYTHFYQYDGKGRLISEKLIGDLGEIIYGTGTVTSPYGKEEIAYLPQEKLIRYSLDGVIYTYPLTSNNELVVEMPEISRDSRGRILQHENTNYFYDEDDRLVKVSSPSGTVEYGYNEGGARISRTLEGKIE